jgi:hypothetical protein
MIISEESQKCVTTLFLDQEWGILSAEPSRTPCSYACSREPPEGKEASMSIPILATKLYHPRLRPHMVSRRRLTERLNVGLHRKLTLTSAPLALAKARW